MREALRAPGRIGPNDLDLIYLTDDVDDAVRHIREAGGVPGAAG
jgi:hypothetical protein